jgi:hypothetical protein
VKRSQYRWIAGAAATIALIGATVVVVDPGAGGDEPANRQATATYLDAQSRLVAAQEAALPASRVAARRYADGVLKQCRGAIAAAPIPSKDVTSRGVTQAAKGIELSQEVADAVAIAAEPQFHDGQGELRRLRSEATSVRWHDKTLNKLMNLRAAEEAAWEGLAVPNVCRDLNEWARHGYGAIPATSRAFLKRWDEIEHLAPERLYGPDVQAVGGTSLTKTIMTKLVPYEDNPATKRLGVSVGVREERLGRGYTEVALHEAGRLYHGLGFDFCKTRGGGEQRCR